MTASERARLRAAAIISHYDRTGRWPRGSASNQSPGSGPDAAERRLGMSLTLARTYVRTGQARSRLYVDVADLLDGLVGREAWTVAGWIPLTSRQALSRAVASVAYAREHGILPTMSRGSDATDLGAWIMLLRRREQHGRPHPASHDAAIAYLDEHWPGWRERGWRGDRARWQAHDK